MNNGVRIYIQTGRRALLAVAVAAGLLLTLGACGGVPGIYTYENQHQGAKAAAGFDAKSYVDTIWKSKVLPAVDKNAVEAATLLDAIATNPDEAAKKYAKVSGTGAAPAFLIKGQGRVTAIDTSAPTGPVTVALAGDPGKTVTLVTGPVIAGTAIRDAVGFITFGQFTNQIDYADVATQLNDRVRSDVAAKLDKASLTGKTLTFEGAFSLLSPTVISVVPTTAQVAQ